MSVDPTNVWRAIGLPRVDGNNLEVTVSDIGWVWQDCIHVTANESMAKEMRGRGLIAIAISEFSDLVVWANMPPEWNINVDAYPELRPNPKKDGSNREDAGIEDQIREWRRRFRTVKVRLGIDLDYVVRMHLRRDARNPEVARILLRSATELRQSIMFLINAGFSWKDFVATDPSLQVALDVWQWLEDERPICAKFRQDLWANPSAIADPTTAVDRSLRERLMATISKLGGPEQVRTRIVYHGFYFFTPPQWALFRLLRVIPDTDQLFIVHDDGRSRAHETWRRYFVERWEMPRVELRGTAIAEPRSLALADALEGRPVDVGAVGNSLRIIKCRNTTEFVRQWKHEVSEAVGRDKAPPTLFAPNRSDVKRVLDRMTGDAPSSVNLANLPVGQFLLALHECYDTSSSGLPELVMSAGHLVDIVASGLVDSGNDSLAPSGAVAAFKRAMPFFDDLRRLDDWCERAVALERLIVAEVSPLGARAEGRSDVLRIRTTAANELRLAPWCDLSDTEARVIKETIHRTRELLAELVSDGMRRTDKYLEWVRKRLERAMSTMTPNERAVLESKFHGVDVGAGYELDFEGIREVVELILGRSVDKGLAGEEDDDDEHESAYSRVKDVRFADVVGFAGSGADVHLANLSDDAFPSVVSPFAWPFSEDALISGAGEPVSIELFRTRRENSTLEGLYLLSLLLEGTPLSRRVTLSWIEESAGETRSPSPLLSMISDLSKPKRPTVEVMARIGGTKIENVVQAGLGVANLTPVPSRADQGLADTAVATAVAEVDRLATSSAVACSRRFVLQWALGPSAAFQSSHNHAMLFGNIQGVMFRRGRYRPGSDDDRTRKVRRTTKDLWRHLTGGQRRSSYFKRVVHETGRSASWHWAFTLAGSQQGTSGRDRAYQAARGGPIPLAAIVGSDASAIIPMPGPDVTKKECDNCPVAPRCSVRILDVGDD
jgi:hypothetical protein